MTDISQQTKMLIEILESKNLFLIIERNKFHVCNKRNDLLFVGTFEQVVDWVEAIHYSGNEITYLKPIELGYFDPIEIPYNYLPAYMWGSISCIFFILGIIFHTAIGFAGIPSIITAFYYFHKYNQQNKKTK